MTTVSFSKIDENLAAIARALAVQVAGFQIVSGMNARQLVRHRSYLFDFDQHQAERFMELMDTYLPREFRETIEIKSLYN